jgi:rubrerythrin
MTKSDEYLMEAFAGESMANRKYLAYAAEADKEGLAQAARLFRAAAESETIHAMNHLKAVKGIKSTKENLMAAIGGEREEFESMYPEMIKTAQAEGNKAADRSFQFANEVEKVHAVLFKKSLDGLESETKAFPYYVCPLCGYVAEAGAPDKCPICGTKGGLFKKIE